MVDSALFIGWGQVWATCDVGKHSCDANEKTATVTCKRADGYRFSRQTGE